jgi:hypothetical protein
MSQPNVKQLDIGDNVAIDWLMYRSYEFNRTRSPHVKPESWRKIYFNAETYEKIYQQNNTLEVSHDYART